MQLTGFGRNLKNYFLATFGSKIISFLMLPYFMTQLSSEEFGVVDLVQTTVKLAVPYMAFSIIFALVRFSFDDPTRRIISISWRLLKFFMLGGSVIVALCILLGFYHIAAGIVLFNVIGLQRFYEEYARIENRTNLLVWSSWAWTVLMALSNYLLFRSNLFAPSISYLLGFITAHIVAFGFLYNSLPRIANAGIVPSREYISLIRYGFPMAVNSTSWWLINGATKYLILYSLGISMNGIYGVSMRYASVLSLLISVYSKTISVDGLKMLEKDLLSTRRYDVIFIISAFVIYILYCVFLFLLRDYLFINEYSLSYSLSIKLGAIALIGGYSGALGYYFSFVKNTKILLTSTLIGSVLGLGVSLVSVGTLGIDGIVLGLFVANVMILMHRLKHREWQNIVLYFGISFLIICWITRIE